jgi:hypothetical protein
MKIDKFDIWQWREDSNCWDFVITWILEKQGVELPRFGILPSNKKEMTKAARNIIKNYLTEVHEPVSGAIAAHYFGKINWHVGIVDGDFVRHTGEKIGTCKHSIKQFERMAPLTRYFLINGNT